MQLVYVRNARKAKSARMIACGFAAVAVAALMTGPPMPAQLIPLAGIGAAAMWWVAQRLAATPDPTGPAQLLGDEPATDVNDLVLPSRLRHDPTIARVVQVCQGTLRDQVILDVDSVKFDGQHVVEFALKCVTAGGLASTGLATRVQNAVRKAVPVASGAASWKMTPDSRTDRLVFSGVEQIPRKVYPPNWNVVGTRDEAGRVGRDLTWRLGEAADGPVELSVNKFPHGVVFSPTGGGKSIFVKANIERFLAAGGISLLGDGKGTDYPTYRNRAGVVAVGARGANGMAYFGVIELGHRIMNQRLDLGPSRKMANPETWEDVPRVLLVLDELKSMLGIWDSSDLDADEKRFIQSRVDQIGALGRQPRVHLLMATQDLYDKSIRGSWLNNAQMRVCLAKPAKREVQKAFEPSIQAEVLRVAAAFDDSIRGRGMVAAYDSDSGATAIKEFQGYYGYAPGEDLPNDPEGNAKWRDFKSSVSDRIPRLHPRIWFRLDEPSIRQQELEAKEGSKPLGYIDFELFTPSEISRLEVVNLDRQDESGAWVPDPAMLPYDPHPLNTDYVGHPPAGAAAALLPQEM
ncbi:hypothetical protein AWC31_14175 [Mycolicibacterium wolinskyi]|uniref:Cell division protein FtsK n=2 Tax=Mycobacteriaceae TaxID=1762 RepID=A0A1X2FJ31_9MYCO|nr:hypothetical protein AWC31_14175 [Mycolicibacterium wolinskyi]